MSNTKKTKAELCKRGVKLAHELKPTWHSDSKALANVGFPGPKLCYNKRSKTK